MIKLKVTHFHNKLFLGEYTFDKNRVQIGSSISNDIVIDSKKFLDIHFYLEVNQNKLMIYHDQKIAHFHLNGKRSKGSHFIKVGDTIKSYDLEFKILLFANSDHETFDNAIDRMTEELLKKDPQYLDIFIERSADDF